jgi:hypothetical protein
MRLCVAVSAPFGQSTPVSLLVFNHFSPTTQQLRGVDISAFGWRALDAPRFGPSPLGYYLLAPVVCLSALLCVTYVCAHAL